MILACVPANDEGGAEENAATETDSTETGTGSTTDTDTTTDTGSTTDTGDAETGSGDAETGSGDAETGSGDTETGSTDTDTETETGESCIENDPWEPNELPEDAAVFEWPDGLYGSLYEQIDDAFLCSGEDDWYRFNVSNIDFEYDGDYNPDNPETNDNEFHALLIDTIVQGSSWCGNYDSCEVDSLPEAPENGMSVEIYDAETLELLASSTSMSGRVDIDGSGSAFTHDILVHVSGLSPEASYVYDLHYELRAIDGEDECEC